MRRYIVEDEEIKSYIPNDFQNQKVVKKTNYMNICIVVLVVLILIIILVANLNIFSNRYSSLEKKMIDSAKDYIETTGYNSGKETYINVDKLNIDFPDDCSKVSGIFYKADSYTPYLLCQNYESDKPTADNKINLVGNDIVFIQLGGKYYELGYINYSDASISGNVNTNQSGLYNVYYISKNSNEMSVRKVIVLDNVVNLFPVITTTDDVIDINIGENYNSKVTAIDKIDGDLSYNWIKQNNVNINEVGTYSVIYSVTNSLGYTTMKSQTVNVLNPSQEETVIFTEISNENMTNENVNVNVKVVGGKYSYMILPDGSTTKDMEIDYEVIENGTYEFTVVNTDQTKVYKKVKIDNIDKTLPTGTCTTTLYNDRTIFNVSVTSFNHIVGYNYYIGSIGSGYLTNGSYTTSKTDAKNFSVALKDYIGNESTINCTVSDHKTYFDPNGYRVVIRDKPRLHIPIGEALSKKGYTISDLNRCIYKRVVDAGPYTRWGVTAAAFGLIECTYNMTGYVLPYNHTSGKVTIEKDGTNYCKFNSDICGKLGVSSRWGSKGGICSSNKEKQCYHGLNCATFVRWSMCNGGMDLCSRGEASAFAMTNKEFFPEADGVYIKSGKVSYYSGRNFSNYSAEQLFRMIKPGDIMATSEGGGHTFVIVGIDNDGIYTAEDGYFMRYLKFTTLVKSNENQLILFLDNYYANPKNRNNFYG